MTQVLHNQVALVTGGTAGIGKAIALKFAQEGAKVVLFGTNPERGQQATEEIQAIVGQNQVHFRQVDVSKKQEVDSTVQEIIDQFGLIDILVNNAGITRDLLFMKMSEEDWDNVMDVNVKSCYNLCHALVRPMMKARKGAIINMSSVVGLTGNAGQVNYASSKAAIVGFTKALAKELASRSITVNCIAPGFIMTRMTEVLNDSQKESILSQIPLGRIGEPEEVADAALFLARARYITGQVMVVDGGMVM